MKFWHYSHIELRNTLYWRVVSNPDRLYYNCQRAGGIKLLLYSPNPFRSGAFVSMTILLPSSNICTAEERNSKSVSLALRLADNNR